MSDCEHVHCNEPANIQIVFETVGRRAQYCQEHWDDMDDFLKEGVAEVNKIE
jgi:hypothetical protein